MNRSKQKDSKIERVPITLPISKYHKDLQLYIVVFLNGYPFLATKTSKVNLITSKPLISRTTSHINRDIDTVLDLFEERGCNITAVNGENDFKTKTLKSYFIPMCTHIYGKEENIGTI